MYTAFCKWTYLLYLFQVFRKGLSVNLSQVSAQKTPYWIPLLPNRNCSAYRFLSPAFQSNCYKKLFRPLSDQLYCPINPSHERPASIYPVTSFGNSGARKRDTCANDRSPRRWRFMDGRYKVFRLKRRAFATVQVSRRTDGRGMAARMENGDFDQRGNT